MPTPTYGFPFPSLGDVPNIPADIEALAEAVDDEFQRVDADIAIAGGRYVTCVKTGSTAISNPASGSFVNMSLTDTIVAPATADIDPSPGASIRVKVAGYYRLDYILQFTFTGDNVFLQGTRYEHANANDYFQVTGYWLDGTSNARLAIGISKNGTNVSASNRTYWWGTGSGADVAGYNNPNLQVTLLSRD